MGKLHFFRKHNRLNRKKLKLKNYKHKLIQKRVLKDSFGHRYPWEIWERDFSLSLKKMIILLIYLFRVLHKNPNIIFQFTKEVEFWSILSHIEK